MRSRLAAVQLGRAKDAVSSPRYRFLLLDTLCWLENGDWTKRSQRNGERPIERFAAATLTRRTKKATKKAKKHGRGTNPFKKEWLRLVRSKRFQYV